MPKYLVRVKYGYHVEAISAKDTVKDALSAIPIATHMKYLNADGMIETINSKGKVVAKAKKERVKRGSAKRSEGDSKEAIQE